MRAARKSYLTDLTNEQWDLLKEFIPAAKPGGRPRKVEPREIVNAIFYILSAGCPWRMLPHDFPVWQTVYEYFRNWRMEKIWEPINRTFNQWVRVSGGKEATPSVAITDSQSVQKRWVVERTFGWFNWSRRLSKDYEILTDTSEAFLYIAMIRLSLRRLA